MKHVKVGSVTVGEGRPKIIVPLTGQSQEEILLEAHQARKSPCDIVTGFKESKRTVQWPICRTRFVT